MHTYPLHQYPHLYLNPPLIPPLHQRGAHLLGMLVTLVILLSTLLAHAEPPNAAGPKETTCEVCIPVEYKQACEDAASDAQAYYGETRAVTRRAREAEDRAREAELARALARMEAERAEGQVWVYFGAGAAGATLILLALAFSLGQ